MPVEYLVVDHHDVGEAVNRLTVPVDHGHRLTGRPPCRLTRPVGLHHVGHDGQQREGVRHLRGQQCLCGLAEPRLVCQQEGPVACRHSSQQPRLMHHQVHALRQHGLSGLRKLHADRSARSRMLERVQYGPDQLPAGQPSLHLRPRRAEVGGEERVGQLGRGHRRRQGPLLDGHCGRRDGAAYAVVRRGLAAGGELHLALQPTSCVGDLGVPLQQGEQRGLACRRQRERGRDLVQSLEEALPANLGDRRVGPNPGAFIADQQRHRMQT